MQIPSGFEVKRVVFMCVRAFVFVSVRTCTPAEIHLCICLSVYIHAYIYIYTCIYRAEVQFCSTPSFFLFTHSETQVGMKLKVCSFKPR